MQFHSNLHLILKSNVGLYVSYNSGGNGIVPYRPMIFRAFLDRYFPDSEEKSKVLDTAKADAAAVSGIYMNSRRPEGSLFRILAILGQTNVTVNEDSTISASDFKEPNGKPSRFEEVAPMTFKNVNGSDRLIFKPDTEGRMRMIMDYPFMVSTRVGMMENSSVILPVIGISLGIMLLTLVLWFVSWWVRKHYGHKLELSGLDWWLRIAVRVVFALNLIFLIALISYASAGLRNLDLLGSSGVKWLYLMQVVGLLGALGTVLVIYNSIRTWINKDRGIWIKLQSTVFVLACIGFLWFVYVGNLLSFTSAY